MALANPLECISASHRTCAPSFTVVGGALVAIKYKNGVMLAADTAAMHGSLKRKMNYGRIRKLGNNMLIAGGGELADFEYLMKRLEEYELEDWCYSDGVSIDPAEELSLISRITYERRTKMNPLLISVVVAGYKNDKPFLGYTDQFGTVFEDEYVCTGLGRFFGSTFITERHSADMSEEAARALLYDSWKAMIASDPNAADTVQFATATADGMQIMDAVKIELDWAAPIYFKKKLSHW